MTAKSTLNIFWFKLIVFGLHFILVGVLLSLFFIFDVSHQITELYSIDAVSQLYASISANWLAFVREVAHTVLALFDGLGGAFLVVYGLKRQHIIPRYFAVAIGSQLLFSSALSISLLGLVAWGGIWHFISAGVAILMGGSAAITFAALTLFWESLIEIGKTQDALYEKAGFTTSQIQ